MIDQVVDAILEERRREAAQQRRIAAARRAGASLATSRSVRGRVGARLVALGERIAGPAIRGATPAHVRSGR